MIIKLKVPIVQAVQWDPWLTNKLAQAADRAGVGFDGGEEMGPFEVFAFDSNSAEQVRDLTAEVLTATDPDLAVTVTGEGEVTVAVPPSNWLVALISGQEAYSRALRRLSRETADRPEFAAWWSGSRHDTLLFHQAHDVKGTKVWSFVDTDDDPPMLLVTAQVDLTILDVDRPAQGEPARAAKENLGRVLNRVAEHLGLEHPPAL